MGRCARVGAAMENYKLGKRIGRGNYGTVYVALDKRNNRWYCLKTIVMEAHSDEEREKAQLEEELDAVRPRPNTRCAERRPSRRRRRSRVARAEASAPRGETGSGDAGSAPRALCCPRRGETRRS